MKLNDRNIKEMEKCPYCKSKDGYYVKIQYSGSGIYRYNYGDEQTIDNGDMYDYLTGEFSKYYYCLNCKKRIARCNNE